MGQYADQIPVKTGTNLSHTGILFSQGQHKNKNTWLFLDACSSNSVSNIPIMMKNMDNFNNKDILTFHMNGGPKDSLQLGVKIIRERWDVRLPRN